MTKRQLQEVGVFNSHEFVDRGNVFVVYIPYSARTQYVEIEKIEITRESHAGKSHARN